jgi:hypothetical protein
MGFRVNVIAMLSHRLGRTISVTLPHHADRKLIIRGHACTARRAAIALIYRRFSYFLLDASSKRGKHKRTLGSCQQ